MVRGTPIVPLQFKELTHRLASASRYPREMGYPFHDKQVAGKTQLGSQLGLPAVDPV